MLNEADRKQWFAIYARHNCEFAVLARLRALEVESFCPTYRATTNRFGKTALGEALLFPGYLFIRINWQGGPRLYTIPGFIRALGTSKGPTPIADEEIEFIQRALSEGTAISPCPYLATGTIVSLISGPLRGLRGIYLKSRGNDKLVLSLDLLHRSMSVDVKREWVSVEKEPIDRYILAGN
jgi:transcription antitermination factor NusG